MRNFIDHVQRILETALPVNVSGVDSPAHWIDGSAPEDADSNDVADQFNPFVSSGRHAHAEIGRVGGQPAWIVSIEDGEEIDSRYWTQGRCAAFAQAMNRIYGLPIWATFEHNVSAEREGDTAPDSLDSLIHAFVVAGDYAVDEKGVTPLANLTQQNGHPIQHDDRFFSDDECVLETRSTSVEELEQIHQSDCHGSMAAVRHIRAKQKFYDDLIRKALEE